jgi:hypothetical protein
MENCSRRTALKLSAHAFLTMSAAMPFLGCSSQSDSVKPEKVLPWDQFLEKVQKLSKSQFEPDWAQEDYSKDVVGVIKALNLEDKFISSFISRYKNAHKNFPEIRAMHKEHDFQVSLLEFESGEKIKLHDHPDMSGVILCTEGRINIQNYDLLKNKSTNNKLLLKQTANITMVPGSTGFLTSASGNIHALQADRFTRLIDVFTPPYNRDRSKRSKWYSKANTYYEGTAGIFEAKTS